MRRIESDNISAVAVTVCLNELMNQMKSANEYDFFSPAVKAEMRILENDGHRIREFKARAFDFRTDCYEYLSAWCEQFKHVESFKWVLLTESPVWTDIEKSIEYLVENKHLEGKFPKHQKKYYSNKKKKQLNSVFKSII